MISLVCGLMSQSIALVISKGSVNPTILFIGKLRLSGLPVLSELSINNVL